MVAQKVIEAARALELPEISCLQNIGGPGGDAVGEGERNRAQNLHTMGLLTDTHKRAHMQGPGKRHSAACLNVLSQSPTVSGTGGVQGPRGGGGGKQDQVQLHG